MSGRRACALVVLALGPTAIAEACTSHVPEYALVDGGLEGGDETPADAAPDTVDGSDGAPREASALPQTHLRFALWSPDAPAVDFCVAPRAPADAAAGEGGPVSVGDAGEDWEGPLVGQEATRIDGGIIVVFDGETESGLSFPQVSAYFALPAGAYDVRVVAAGSGDCSMPLIGSDATHLPTFQAGAFSTVAAVGDYQQAGTDPEMGVVAFGDDTSSAAGDIALRFIATLPSVASMSLDLGAPGSPGSRELFSDVAFGEASKDSDAGTIDGDGYLTTKPLANATFSALRASKAADAGPPLIVADGVTIPEKSVATLVAVGGKTGPGPAPELVLCFDTAPAVSAVFASCSVLATPSD